MIAYRPDIDGLRALAVALVIVFHAKFGIFSGGYIGVDVFFVISGYLIASIIAKDVADGRFSIAQFYERRARRILPALFVVLLACTAAAAVLMVLPQDLTVFAKSARATLLFFSNFFFSRHGGYFGLAVETQPLLHTWSLGVEEQFYLVAPLLLAPLMRKSTPRRWAIFALVWVAFLYVSQHSVMRGTTAAFYWPHARVFELMLGVALASPYARPLTSNVLRGAAAVTGLAMILLAAVFYVPKMPFPGIAALLPCGGAALLIWTGKGEGCWVSRMMSAGPMVFTGKISYPLYLWHWPIFVFAGMLPVPLTEPLDRVLQIALAVLLAVATYYLVERPIRSAVSIDAFTRRRVFAYAVSGLVVCMLPQQAFIWSGGWTQRFGPEVAAFARNNPTTPPANFCQRKSGALPFVRSDCIIGQGEAAEPTFIVWGDSHARMIAPALSDIAKAKGLKGYVISRGGCPPLQLQAADWFGEMKCPETSRHAMQLAENASIASIVLDARWSIYAPDLPPADGLAGFLDHTERRIRSPEKFASLLKETVQRLATGRRNIIIIGPVPEPAIDVPRKMMRDLIEGHPTDIAIATAAFETRNAFVLRTLAEVDELPGVRVIYPHPSFCDDTQCKASEGNRALYIDKNHLSPAGVEKIHGLLATVFETGEYSASLTIPPH